MIGYITLAEWAARLGISTRRAYFLIAQGRVPGVIRGGTLVPADTPDPRLPRGRPHADPARQRNFREWMNKERLS